jgi:MYXO-CTERM domain-containing protein
MDFVLTRLHARYGKDITNDLQFKTADPIVGGREHVIDPQTHKLEEGAQKSSMNNFQGRYAIRHEWTGPIKCANPVRGRWGGPNGQDKPTTKPGLDLAFAPRGAVKLPEAVKQPIPELALTPVLDSVKPTPPIDKPQTPTPPIDTPQTPTPAPTPTPTQTTKPAKSGCGCASSGDASGLVMLGLLLLRTRSRRRCPSRS